MRITKYGHCCLLLEVNEKRILIDPGKFSTPPDSPIDIILITHEHVDHFHSEAVRELLAKNPTAVVVTNTSVATLLKTLGVDAHILEGEASDTVASIPLTAFDGAHQEIVGTFGLVQNTGYLVANRFYFAGDAYTIPAAVVDILSVPVAGPWCKVSEAIAFVKAVHPRVAIPVHDATLSDIGKQVTYPHFKRELAAENIQFISLDEGGQEV